MITEPFEMIGVGSELIGMFHDEGMMTTPEVTRDFSVHVQSYIRDCVFDHHVLPSHFEYLA